MQYSHMANAKQKLKMYFDFLCASKTNPVCFKWSENIFLPTTFLPGYPAQQEQSKFTNK